MSLTNEERMLIEEALQVYLQLVARQMQPQQVQQLTQLAKGLIAKLDTLQAGGAAPGDKPVKPAGISDEWYKQVCQDCVKLTPGGCTDKVTAKFPGKCDPILHYEMDKIKKKSKGLFGK